ncbi:MAG: hypothetical protein ACD_54C00914G0003 [uncultured bacterium]|nr:MAG: hypothetical protein ACD_54C00914G0003 [uncultured bacterium]
MAVVEPGTRKISDTRPSRRMLRRLSMRSLPFQSGSSRVSSSWIVTTGPSSPRGLPSVPSGPTVERMQKREAAMKAA